MTVMIRRLATRGELPHLAVPKERARLIVADVALADSALAHAQLVRTWAEDVWRAWSSQHDVAREPAKDLVAGKASDVR